MREPAPDYSSRQYERPNQPWVCGLAIEGQACPAGPTIGGQCPALAECAPARDGDRWQCNRSALRGGLCAEGPTPEGGCGRVHRCRPVRSLRAMRGRFVTACTVIAAGGLLILLSADWRNEVISPGPLARQHAQLSQDRASQPNCAACHGAAERSAMGWTVSLVGVHGGKLNQSQRCMKCHNKTIAAEFPLAAHNLPADALSKLTTSGEKKSTDEPACATCHREHQGAQFDLTAMSDAACQSCHQRRYESFASDHPDFGKWPYVRRTRIVFNHASHRAKHFAEKKQSFDCRACHLDDATGDVQLLANYDAACAACHDEKIATSVATGVPIVGLPTLDVEALKAAGHDIRTWPEDAIGDFDGRLSPMMKLLLASDPNAARAIETLGADFDFFDVDPDDPEHLKAAATLAAAIKKLLVDLNKSGAAAARERLQTALGRPISDAQFNILLAGLPAETLGNALKAWLPDSLASVAAGNVDSPTSQSGKDLSSKRGTTRSVAYDPAGTWLRDDPTLSIRYRPSAHADPMLAGWLELLASTPDLEKRPVALAMFKELSKPTAPGLCASCHSVERTAGGRYAINWRASDRTSEPRGLTNFSHRPHLLLPELADCTNCHAIDDSAETASAYAGDDPHSFVSEFAGMTKQHCAQCHTAKAAGDACQKCHNYHVDEIEEWREK